MQLRFNGSYSKSFSIRLLSHIFQLNCDVNCCCDIDCTDGILKAFVCDDGVEIEDYHHGEGLERCEINDGLFCIIDDNSKAPDYYVSPLKSNLN